MPRAPLPPLVGRLLAHLGLWAAAAIALPPAAVAAPPSPPAATTTADWAGPPVWPSPEAIDSLVNRWAAGHRQRLRVIELGRSAGGRRLFALRLTDASVADADKEHVLLTALHAGLERSATTTVLAIAEWLLSGAAAADETLRRQVIVCLPLPDPDAYVAGRFSPLYNQWTLDGPRDRHSPEANAVCRLFDEYQPEVHADIHGVSLDFARYIMFESSGASYSNLSLRPFHRDVMTLMDDAALAAGFASDKVESDAERLYWGPGLDAIKGKLWLGRPQPYAALYAYNRYHTMTLASEVRWEQSGLVRHRRLFQIGNETWPGESSPGYPVRVIMSSPHVHLVACGATAAQRRKSRVELWNRLDQLSLAVLDPVCEGRLLVACATTAAASRRWLAGGEMARVVDALRQNPQIDAAALARFIAGWPAGQNSPRPMLYLQSGAAAAGTSPMGKAPGDGASLPSAAAPFAGGLALRLRLPYSMARLTEVRLNGHRLPAAAEGYVAWSARGCTIVEIGLPPARRAADEVFVVTCAYDPGEVRKPWESWRR